METPKSLYISNVEDQFTASCIVNLFYNEGIANICRVTLIPEDKFDITKMNPDKLYNKAYIEISTWHNTIKAHNILSCLESNDYKPTLFYDEDNCWEIKINKRPAICYKDINKPYTTIFKPSTLIYDTSFNTNTIPMPMPMPMYYPTYNTMLPYYYTYPYQLSSNFVVPY
jgi:hypothetical protein